jgi:arginine deiminase
MNSKKFSNQDLINATFEIYEKFNTQNGIKKNGKINNNNSKPLLLSKEVRPQKKTVKEKLSKKTTDHEKISNAQRLKAYTLKKNKISNLGTLKLNKIIKFENKNYLLLHKIKNSDLKIIKIKRPS